jgi:hypothetical protein
MPLNLSAESYKTYLNLNKSIETRLINSYGKALDDVTAKIQEVYAKWGANPSITEVRKFNRLARIEQELQQRLEDLNKELNFMLGAQIKTAALTGYSSTLSNIESKGFGFDFGGLNLNEKGLKNFLSDTLWTDAMNNNAGTLWSDVKREFETVLRANSREEIISGVAQGKSYNDIRKALQDRFEVSASRAKKIAFTETHKAHSYGRNEGINSAMAEADKIGLKTAKVWRHNGAKEPRPDHVAADGTYADEKGMFNVGGEEMQAPGLGSDPSNNIYCHCSAEFEVIDERYTGAQDQDRMKNLTEDLPAPETPAEIETSPEAYYKEFDKDIKTMEEIWGSKLSVYETRIEGVRGRMDPNVSKLLSNNEIKTVMLYTSNSYMSLNKYLYGDVEWARDLISPSIGITKAKSAVEAFNRNLSRVLNKLPNYDGKVMRVVNSNYTPGIEELKNSIGKEFSWKGFSSLGKKGSNFLSPDALHDNITFVIKGKTGKDIETMSTIPFEKEVLFNANSRFKITKVKQTSMAFEQEYGYRTTYVYITEL